MGQARTYYEVFLMERYGELPEKILTEPQEVENNFYDTELESQKVSDQWEQQLWEDSQ